MIYFHSFPQLVMGDQVFVAMPMSDPSFAEVWTEIYQIAIKSVGLEPFRVDLPQTGDSILIEILGGLRRAKLVLADITPDRYSGKFPNANVLYELGLAHSIRLPETVIVVRSGSEDPPFDIRHLRYLPYDRNDIETSQATIRGYLHSALQNQNFLQEELIERVWLSMNPACRDIIAREWYIVSGRAEEDAQHQGEKYENPHKGSFNYPVGNVGYMRWKDDQVRLAFNMLLEFGLIEPVDKRWDISGREFPTALYRFTELGKTVGRRFTSIV